MCVRVCVCMCVCVCMYVCMYYIKGYIQKVTIKLHSKFNPLLLKILNNFFFIFAESSTDMFLKQLEPSYLYKDGTIIRTWTTCKEIPLYKSIEFGMALK